MDRYDSDLDDEFQAVYIQKPKVTPNSENPTMGPILQTYPPLGQVTCADNGFLTIQAILKVPRAQAREDWKLSLWYSADESKWVECSFRELAPSRQPVPQSLQTESDSTVDLFFYTKVAFFSTLNFTVKFKSEPGLPWVWVRDEHGFDDGIVLVPAARAASTDVPDLIKNLNPEWNVRERMSESPKSRLWSLRTSMPCPEGNVSSTRNIQIGTPWGSFLRWFALVRQTASWLAPRQGKSQVHLDKDAILFAFLGTNGSYLVFLPISGTNDTTSVMKYTADEDLVLQARCDAPSDLGNSPVTLLVSESEDFDCAVAAVMYHARGLMTQQASAMDKVEPVEEELATSDDEVHSTWIETWYDGLGYCTWNSIGQELTEKKLNHALDSLAENNIEITSLIIDDNWQSVDTQGTNPSQRGWLDFEADSKAFPDGLSNTVRSLRRKYHNIRYVAVWHAMLGYWGGISPTGKLAKSYKTVEVERQDPDNGQLGPEKKMTVIAKEDVSRFYRDFFNFLRYSMVNAIKTDAQFMMDTWTGSKARRELTKEYLDVWNLQALRYFGMRAVSCMSQFPQSLFYSGMRSTRIDSVLRNSDDYFPNEPKSHAWHVWANAHNAIFTKHLNVIPDWDMFQTKHEYGGFHAAARCISGGPIWITDVPGEYDLDLIRQISGRTTRYRTVIFRPQCFAKTTDPFVGYHDDILLKVGTYHGGSQTGTSLLSIFNVSERSLAEIIPLSTFPGIVRDLQYVVRSYKSGKTSSPMAYGHREAFISGSYDIAEYDIWSAAPLQTVPSHKHWSVSVANFGLLDKMTGSVAIARYDVSRKDNGRVFVDTTLKALGVLGLYISTLPELSIDEDFMVTIFGKPVPRHTVAISADSDFVLTVDVERAWNEMGQISGYSNEIRVLVTFSS